MPTKSWTDSMRAAFTGGRAHAQERTMIALFKLAEAGTVGSAMAAALLGKNVRGLSDRSEKKSNMPAKPIHVPRAAFRIIPHGPAAAAAAIG